MSNCPQKGTNMADQTKETADKKGTQPSSRDLLALAKPYTRAIVIIFVLSLVVNGLNLVVPEFVASAIDAFGKPLFSLNYYLWVLIGISRWYFYTRALAEYSSDISFRAHCKRSSYSSYFKNKRTAVRFHQ